MIADIQTIQEAQYEFPYHYLPRYEDGRFRFSQTLTWAFEYLGYVSFVKEQLIAQEFSNLIDFGCGDGRLLAEIGKEKAMIGKELVGVDYSERAVTLANCLSTRARYICCDLYNPTSLARQFDIGTTVETLEHIPVKDLSRFVSAMAMRLKQNAKLFVTVPSKNRPVNAKHYQHFDRTSITNALAQDFEIEQIKFLNRESRLMNWVILPLLHNRIFILNQGSLLGMLYKWYLRNCLLATEDNGNRVFVVAKKK